MLLNVNRISKACSPIWATSQRGVGRKEVAGIEKRRMEAAEMSLILLLCPLGHGAPSLLLCHPHSSIITGKQQDQPQPVVQHCRTQGFTLISGWKMKSLNQG